MTTNRFCPNCGAQVNASERFCANCGSRMPDAPPSEPTQVLGSMPTPPPSSANEPPSFTIPPSVPSIEPPKRTGCPIWAMVLVGVLGLCVVMGGASIFALSLLGQRVSDVFSEIEAEIGTITLDPTVLAALEATPEAVPTIPPLATVGSIPTRAVQPTPGASNDDAAVLQTSIAATVEAALGEADTLVATIEAETIFASARQIFRDEFVDNRNNWFTGVFREIETNTIADGVFKVNWLADGFSYELYQVSDLTNFVTEVDCLIVQGGPDGSCGLIFGQRPDEGFFEFEVFEDYYRVTLYQFGGEPLTLIEGDPTGIITPGETFRLQIIRRDSEIRAAINNILVGTANNDTFPTGKIGISTNSYLDEGGVEIWFDNFTIWQLP